MFVVNKHNIWSRSMLLGELFGISRSALDIPERSPLVCRIRSLIALADLSPLQWRVHIEPERVFEENIELSLSFWSFCFALVLSEDPQDYPMFAGQPQGCLGRQSS